MKPSEIHDISGVFLLFLAYIPLILGSVTGSGAMLFTALGVFLSAIFFMLRAIYSRLGEQ